MQTVVVRLAVDCLVESQDRGSAEEFVIASWAAYQELGAAKSPSYLLSVLVSWRGLQDLFGILGY